MQFDGRPLNRMDIAYLETDNFFYTNITGLEFLDLFSDDLTDIPIWNELLKLPLDELVEHYKITHQVQKEGFIEFHQTLMAQISSTQDASLGRLFY